MMGTLFNDWKVGDGFNGCPYCDDCNGCNACCFSIADVVACHANLE